MEINHVNDELQFIYTWINNKQIVKKHNALH